MSVFSLSTLKICLTILLFHSMFTYFGRDDIFKKIHKRKKWKRKEQNVVIYG